MTTQGYTKRRNIDFSLLDTRMVHSFPLCDIWTVNSYLECDYGCLYCSSNMQGKAKPLVSNEDVVDLLREEIAGKSTEYWFNFGTMTDPYPPAEEKLGLSRKVLQELVDQKLKIVLCSKSDLLLRDMDILKRYRDQLENPHDALIVRVSISFMDDSWREYFEPNAISSEARFQVIEKLQAEEIPVAVNAWPWVPHATDTDALIERTPSGVPINFNPLVINRDSGRISYQAYSYTQDEIYELYVAERNRVGQKKGITWNYPWSFDEKYQAVGKSPKDNMPPITVINQA